MSQLRRLKPESVQQYVDMHKNVWPDLEKVYKSSGITDISCYINDTFLVVTMEVDTEIFEQAKEELAKNPVERKWQEIMAGFDDPSFPTRTLEEVYRLP